MTTDTDPGTCKHGHPRTEENTYWDTSRHGNALRKCKPCRRQQRRTGRARTGRPPGSKNRPKPPPERFQRHDREQAACRGTDLNLWFRHDGEIGDLPTRIRYAARTYCRQCPIRRRCRGEANALGAVGLWGGTWIDEHQRATPLLTQENAR